MKTLALMLLLPAVSWSCPKGSTEYNGACYIELMPQSDTVDTSKWVSDEKPPTNKMPSYQREGIHIVSAPPGIESSTTTAHDYRAEGSQQ